MISRNNTKCDRCRLASTPTSAALCLMSFSKSPGAVCSSTPFWTVRSTRLRRRDSGLRLQGSDGVSGRRFEDSGSARHVCQRSRLGCEGQGSGGPFHQELHEVHGQRGRQGACCRRSEVVIAGCGLFRTEPRTGRMECHPPRFLCHISSPAGRFQIGGRGGAWTQKRRTAEACAPTVRSL